MCGDAGPAALNAILPHLGMSQHTMQQPAQPRRGRKHAGARRERAGEAAEDGIVGLKGEVEGWEARA